MHVHAGVQAAVAAEQVAPNPGHQTPVQALIKEQATSLDSNKLHWQNAALIAVSTPLEVPPEQDRCHARMLQDAVRGFLDAYKHSHLPVKPAAAGGAGKRHQACLPEPASAVSLTENGLMELRVAVKSLSQVVLGASDGTYALQLADLSQLTDILQLLVHTGNSMTLNSGSEVRRCDVSSPLLHQL